MPNVITIVELSKTIKDKQHQQVQRRIIFINYLFNGRLDNKVHEITYDQLRKLYEDNEREAKETLDMTRSSYCGENFYTENGNLHLELIKEYLERDPRTSGMRMYYPHGVVIEQGARKNYYRGENQLFPESIPTLLRNIKKFNSTKEKELYRLVADMRIAEFSFFLNKFQHVKNWKNSDILYEPLAQHYGLETSWLDITSDFNVALFFATCYWNDGEWKPLTKKQTEIDDNHKYGMIYHMPSYCMPSRWLESLSKFFTFDEENVFVTPDGDEYYQNLLFPKYIGDIPNLIYPIGFQPFMRCHMQNGYGIYMRTPKPLQNDLGFEKLIFRHNEKLSQKVFDMMQRGKKIYPHEGLNKAKFVVEQIKNATSFSEEAFMYALYRNHYFKIDECKKVKNELAKFSINGNKILICDKHPWKISSGRRKNIDEFYSNFSIEDTYNIKIFDRKGSPPLPLFEPWMIPENNTEKGVVDFRARDKVDCGMGIENRMTMQIQQLLMTGKKPDF